jgi:serine/threonine-protein kinase Chk2
MEQIPHQVKNFFIKDKIGSGRSASVHLAQNMTTQEEYCVKIIEKSQRKTHLIQNEIQILKSLNHPNIASFIECIETEAYFLIFQELCKGKTLLDVILESRKLKERNAKKYFIN